MAVFDAGVASRSPFPRMREDPPEHIATCAREPPRGRGCGTRSRSRRPTRAAQARSIQGVRASRTHRHPIACAMRRSQGRSA
jgi:hypothetical protein